jgi:hypothetical protein
MLGQPHVQSLTAFARRLRGRALGYVPDFDPLDGGVNARALFLFEKPGPKTAEPSGSGFISRNNNDPSAEATFCFMQQAGIPRKLTVTWNVIPWWNGTTDIVSHELRNRQECLTELLSLLPNLRVIVLVGGRAAGVESFLKEKYPHLHIVTSAHPAIRVKNRYPDKWNAIPSEWSKILPFLTDNKKPH